jgi:flagellar hook assembly protein FlgD
LSIKPAPITVKVIPAPNPYRPAVKYSGGQPSRIIVRATSKTAMELDLKGTIAIYDNVGNTVLTDTLITPPAGLANADLVYLWDGHNSKGRKVGTGVYLIAVSVEYATEAKEEKGKPATGRAMMCIVR